MKIVLFGSTGAVGQLVIQVALNKGYDVVAFARNPSKILLKNEKLHVIQGELNDLSSVERAVLGCDAVISTLGPIGNDPRNRELGDGYERIIAAMKKNSVKRIIVLGTASIRDNEDTYAFKFRFLVRMVKLIIPGSYKEIVRIGDIIRNSGLDWTIVRVAILTDARSSGKIRYGQYGKDRLGFTVTRTDLAKYFVDQVEDKTFIQKAPAISSQ